MQPKRPDLLAMALGLVAAGLVALIAGIEVARRFGEFRYASAPLWPRPDGSVASPRLARHLPSSSVDASYGEVWDLEETAVAA